MRLPGVERGLGVEEGLCHNSWEIEEEVVVEVEEEKEEDTWPLQILTIINKYACSLVSYWLHLQYDDRSRIDFLDRNVEFDASSRGGAKKKSELKS